jgi:CDP-diacylglycerol--glycerol-3-phosphate 3-phosphatidyltransferase
VAQWNREIFLIPNLLSLLRIFLTPVVGFYLAKNDPQSTILCVAFLVFAAITDGLDGYVARRFNMPSQLGLILDPLADKIFVAVLVIELIAFRSFPIWLSLIIIGRDIIIMLMSLSFLKKRRITLPSNIIGQYTFFAIAVLLLTYVINFSFGKQLIIPVVVLLLVYSALSYGRRFRIMLKEGQTPLWRDRLVFKIVRVGITVVLAGVYIVMLIIEKTS